MARGRFAVGRVVSEGRFTKNGTRDDVGVDEERLV